MERDDNKSTQARSTGSGAQQRMSGNNRSESRNNKPRPRSNRSKRRKKNAILRIFILLLALVGALGAWLFWLRYGPSKEEADLNKYYGITKEDQLAVIIDNEIVSASGITVDGKPYIDYTIVRDHLNSRFYWDSNENVLLYTLPKSIISVGVGSKDYTIAKEKFSEDYTILKTEGSVAYIAMDFIQKYTNIDYEVYEEPVKRIAIKSGSGEVETAILKKNAYIRLKGGVKSKVLTQIEKREKVTVIEKAGDWTKVRSKDGFIGYVKGNNLKDEQAETLSREFTEEEFTSISKDYTINLAWHQVTSQVANNSILQTIANTKGLTTLSPTWFSIADNEGNLKSIASTEYVNYAHQSNIEVWGLVDNFGESVDTYEVLSRTSKRENLTNQLIAAALQTKIDGINIDFENISVEAGEHYIQFIRELSVKCRQNGLVLSVDNYVPKGFNAHYNRKEQGIVVDYLIIMGYDEHYGGSPESGPVASIDFVREGIEETIKEVPANKVINAVPFYTRLWSEVPKTEGELEEEAGTEAANYPTKVKSEALGMTGAENVIASAGVTPEWDEKTQLDYASWESDGVTYKIWLENSKSLEAKLKLMKEYKLAGSAGWKLGLEKPETWELILKYVN